MKEDIMAKAGGGLLKLDAICAKLKQNKLAKNDTTIQDESLPAKDSPDVSEANNNVSEMGEERTDLPSHGGQTTPSSDNGLNYEAGSDTSRPSSNGHNGASEDPAVEQQNGAIHEPLPELIDTADPETVPTTPSQDELAKDDQESFTPRKSRRKNQKPRNIMQYDPNDTGKDNEELEEYELNNKDIDFEAMMNEEEAMDVAEGALDLSRGEIDNEDFAGNQRFVRVASSLDMSEQGQCEDTNFSTDDFGVMDLSCTKPDPSPSGDNSRQSESRAASEDLSSSQSSTELSSQQNTFISLEKYSRDQKKSKALGTSSSEAADIKNYAENTMNELLSMYGLEGGEESESLTSHVPLQTFTSSSILERQSLAAGARPESINDTLRAKLLPKLSYLHQMSQHASRVSMGSSIDVKASISSTSISASSSGGTLTHARVCDGTSLSSSPYPKASYNPSLPSMPAASPSPSGKGFLPDYGKYVKRFASYEECGGNHCRDMAYKEHFHCMDCNFRVFVKKEEMIRHFKWHKKREESLQHGFLRFSPMDDCSKKFLPCTHNGRQTHYHCLQEGCTKVYISTSDVQMHANYHRKDSAIIQEGFQRFRATEDCGTVECSFYGQRTTHFHCRRTGCLYTFKNKADMEKHKTYHQKDEILSKDGFKKFMKYEHCSYQSCRYSKVSNHIHCIRPGCDYVLHSTGQLFSHKRKHERRDFEHAYKRFKDDQKSKAVVNPAIKPMLAQHMALQLAHQQAQQTGQTSQAKSPPIPLGLLKKDQEYVDLEDLCHLNQSASSNGMDVDNDSLSSTDLSQGAAVSAPKSMHNSPSNVIEIKPEGSGLKALPSTLAKLASKLQSSQLSGSLNLTLPAGDLPAVEVKREQTDDEQSPATSQNASQPQVSPQQGFLVKVSPPVNEKRERDETWKKYLTRYTANDPCHSRCQFLYKDHYHCNIARCTSLFRSKDGVREHAKHHEQQDRITTLSFMVYEEGVPCVQGCPHSQYNKHYHCLWADCKHVVTEEDSVFARLEHHKIHEFTRNSVGRKPMAVHVPQMPETFKRKRGRPPKYPKNEIPVVPKIEMTEEEISTQARGHPGDIVIGNGFCTFSNGDPCPDDKCMYFMKEHFHCLRQRCHHATDRTDMLNLHAKDFHSYINIIQGFEFFDRNVNCRRPHCHNNRANRHFHCVKPKCDYSFVRYSTMAQHAKKHELAEMGYSPSSIINPRMPAPTSHSASPRSAPYTSTSTPQQILNATNSSSLVKASGTFFPISTIPKGSGQIYVSSGDGTVQITNTPPVMVPIPHGSNQVPNMMTTHGSVVRAVAPIVIAPIPSPSNLVNIAPKLTEPNEPVKTDRPMPSALPLSMLLQQKSTNMPQLNWLTLKMKMHVGMLQNCGRPFCKLKKKDHYHCFECNQAFSDPIRLKSHVTKHGLRMDQAENIRDIPNPAHPVIPESVEMENAGSSCSEGEQDPGEGPDPNSSLNLNPQAFTNLMTRQGDRADREEEREGGEEREEGGEREQREQAQSSEDEGALVMDLSMPTDKAQSGLENTGGSPSSDEPAMEGVDDGPITEAEDQTDELTNTAMLDVNSGGESQPENLDGTSPARRSSRKRTATRHQDFVDSDAVLAKVRRVSSPRTSKDENIPEGYEKYKFNDDCGVERCAYRQNQSHYHCDRADCVYSFSDRSRFSQHNEKHRRLDTIMGDEFQQYGQKMVCGHPDCEFSCKQSHFHCVKCPFICTDTNKVATHRKHHSKLGEIAAAGFQKFVGSEACGREGCVHSLRQTHYHCTQEGCGVVAMGPTQMSAHRVKHDSLDTPQ